MTIHRLQTAQNGGSYVSTLAVPFPSAVAPGSLLVAVVEVSCGDLSVDISTTGVADSVNGAWTKAGGVTDLFGDPTCNAEVTLWYLNAPAGAGATTVTATFPASGYSAMAIAAYDGITFPLDLQTVVTAKDTGTSHSSGSAATTAPALLLGAFGDTGDSDTYTLGAGWVLAVKRDNESLGQVLLEDRGVGISGAAAGSYAAESTTPFGFDTVGSIFAAFSAVPAVPPPPPARTDLVGSGPLGRGEHRLFVFGRGGAPFVGELSFTGLSYSRRLDDKSTATATIASGSSPILGDLRSWKHELLIARDGEAVWLGPIVPRPSWRPDVVTLQAADLLAWLDVRDIAADLHMTDVDLSDVFARLVHDGMAREPSPGLYAAASHSGVKGTRSYVAAQHQAVGDALRSLGQSGVDYSCILRHLRIGGLTLLPSFTLTDDTLLSPDVTEGEAASRVTVIGASTANIGEPVVARAGGANTELGLVERTINDSDVMTHEGAEHYARDAYAFLNPAPLYVTGTLAPWAPVSFSDLIPGMHVIAKLAGTDRLVDSPSRLTQVDVTVHPSEQGMSETVAVTLVPLGGGA